MKCMPRWSVLTIALVFASACMGTTETEQTSSESEGVQTEDSEPMNYGDDRRFDKLWDECDSGDADACDDLYWESPVGSEYESFALDHRVDTSSVDDADLDDVDVDDDMAEMAFVTTVRANVASLSQATDDQLLEVGYTACETIDAINPQNQQELVAAASAELSTVEEAEEYGFVFGAAATALCPEWEHLFE